MLKRLHTSVKQKVTLQATQADLVNSYTGSNTLNLMASIERRLHGQSPLPACSLLEDKALEEPEHLIFLLLDGLGDSLLERYGNAKGPLRRHRVGQLHSVFPSTTSAAISTIMTARAPAEHGILAWHIHLNEREDIYTTLLGQYRNRSSKRPPAARDLYHAQPMMKAVRQRCQIVQPQFLVESPFTERHLGNAKITGVANLKQLFGHLRHTVQQSGPSYTYAYWPSLDSIGHKCGAGSAEWRQSLREIEAALEDFLARSDGTRYRLVVTADHGMINAEDNQLKPFENNKDLASCLETPVAGEPRSVFCNVQEKRLDDFDTICAERYAKQLINVSTNDLFASGLFGPRTDDKAVPDSVLKRAGNRVLLLKDKRAWTDTLPHETPASMIGVHGGLHPEEVQVPLIVI